MNKIVITGGTGFLGLSLAHFLANKGYQPILIARNKPKDRLDFEFRQWDGHSLGPWMNSLEEAKAIVNLAGRTVDCIKTPENRDVILRSRVDSTKVIGYAMRKLKNPPKVWIQMSTAHIYGDPPEQLCTESSSHGYGLAPYVAEAWEKAFHESKPEQVRGVIFRTSFVIGKKGGALKSLKNIVRMGMGGKVGTGNQGISWIHEFDLNCLIHQAIVDEGFEETYIASAPNPVSNKEFMKRLRSAMKIPIGISAPECITRFGAHYLFRTDPELALYGRYVKSERLEETNFQFQFPDLLPALKNLV